MFIETYFRYEVLGWKTVQDVDKRPDLELGLYNRKADAMKIARSYKDRYGRIEVNRIEIDCHDELNIQGDILVASWENGKKIA